jgi:hypothetical protein
MIFEGLKDKNGDEITGVVTVEQNMVSEKVWLKLKSPYVKTILWFFKRNKNMTVSYLTYDLYEVRDWDCDRYRSEIMRLLEEYNQFLINEEKGDETRNLIRNGCN